MPRAKPISTRFPILSAPGGSSTSCFPDIPNNHEAYSGILSGTRHIVRRRRQKFPEGLCGLTQPERPEQGPRRHAWTVKDYDN